MFTAYLALQYELVAELFAMKEEGGPGAPTKRPQGGVLRAAREAPKGGRQNKKTVGSQVQSINKQLLSRYFLQNQYLAFELNDILGYHTRILNTGFTILCKTANWLKDSYIFL